MVTRALGRGLYFASAVCWFWVFLCAVERPAQAYVDPGSGIFLVQVFSSVFVGFTFLVRKRIRAFFGRLGIQPRKAGKNLATR